MHGVHTTSTSLYHFSPRTFSIRTFQISHMRMILSSLSRCTPPTHMYRVFQTFSTHSGRPHLLGSQIFQGQDCFHSNTADIQSTRIGHGRHLLNRCELSTEFVVCILKSGLAGSLVPMPVEPKPAPVKYALLNLTGVPIGSGA